MKVKHRFSGIDWTARPNEAFARRVRSRPPLDDDVARRPRGARRAAKVLFDRSVNDAYGDPGQSGAGRPARRHAGHASRTATRSTSPGAGASESGDRPFLDRFDLKTGEEAERLWQSREDGYESFVHFVGRRHARDGSSSAASRGPSRRTGSSST